MDGLLNRGSRPRESYPGHTAQPLPCDQLLGTSPLGTWGQASHTGPGGRQTTCSSLTPPRTHLIRLSVSVKEATSGNGLVPRQVNGHHRLIPVLLTQLHHFRGPLCTRHPAGSSAAWPSPFGPTYTKASNWQNPPLSPALTFRS